MKKVSLEKLFEKPLSGEWGIEDSGKGIATPVIRTANFLNSGKLNLDNIVYREIDKTKYDSKLLKFGDIIIEKSGGSPNQPVGRVVYFDIVEKEYFTNNFTSILRPKSDNNSKYVFYLMRHLYDTRKVLKFQNQTTGIINLKLSDYLKQTVVKLSSNINEQNKIVNILDKLDNKILLRQEQLKELSNVIKSRFHEMFGDKYSEDTLLNLCNIIDYRGKTPEKVESGLPFITAKNVKMHYMSLEPREYISKEIYDKVMVRGFPKEGDVLFTTEAPLGNVCRIPNFDTEFYIGQRIVTIQTDKLNSTYLEYALSDKEFIKKYMGKSSGSTVKGIRVRLLEQLTIPVPPRVLQDEFATFVLQVDKSQLAIKKSLEELETLKKSLMQVYFG